MKDNGLTETGPEARLSMLQYADPGTNHFHRPLDPAAKTSLIAGLLFSLTPIPAILAIELGIMGLARTRSGAKRGRPHAIAGLTLGIAGLLMWITALVLTN